MPDLTIRRVAVVNWTPLDGTASVIADELTRLGLEPVSFDADGAVPDDVDMVLTFAPHGPLLPIAAQMARRDRRSRPVFVHWNTENLPDPRIPWRVAGAVGAVRSWADRLAYGRDGVPAGLARVAALHQVQQRLHRFRYLGEYRYACQQGWIDVLADISALYAPRNRARGLPAVHVPWGTSPHWHDDLGLARDIDVLWFGKRRTRRRSNLIDAVRRELLAHGFALHVVDGVEHPFVFGAERTRLLNRARITLNLLTQWYETVLPVRFHMAAGNRCVVVSEPELDHHPRCVAGRHYVAAPADELAARVIHLLRNEPERAEIAEGAHRLVTEELTLANSLRALVQTAAEVVARRAAS